ncbi:ribonuclease H-like domain-containing protein [Clostridium sp. D2Q-11]|uniref:Ribonuclease H-like domain-containing protein n=1 Tax=Anaeromonas frigoriresistens TaxID=2683708 RepID=A0A942UXY3_9FIRM|nr:ribonuclease H-like domain-containing protein [Anaeromonas frigoriresistens]MBS4540165.1 ribonuclease H-like domain-containing protein [Anaeromonas frigoriresistens]
MEIISKELNSFINIPNEKKSIFRNKTFCFFDIETTGFSRLKNKVILIGILYPTQTGIKVIQFFANKLEDEKNLLIKFVGFISKFDIIISFNGDTFDIPFLNKRFEYNNIDYSIDKNINIDLLKEVRNHKTLLDLDNCKLKTVERKLGIFRDDFISGKESIDLYYEYITNKNQDIKELILKHNYDDIYYLPELLKIYDLIEKMSRINSTQNINNCIIQFDSDIRNITLEGERLSIKGTSNILDLKKQMYFKDNYTFKWLPNKGTFELSISIMKGKLSTGKSCSYLDQRMYSFSSLLIDQSKYKLPKELILLEENKNIIYKNIEPLFDSFINQIFKDLYIT